MPTSYYSNGQVAVCIDDESKAGFIHYPTGKVAVAISTASSYQNAFYAYDKDKKGSLLLGLNENAVGFSTGTTRKSADLPKVSIVFTKGGGVLTDELGNITLEWVWVKKLSTDMVLKETVTVKLTEHFTLSFKSKEEIKLEFVNENVKHIIDMGVKVLRQKPNYLQKAKRLPGGHLLPEIEYTSLRQRTIDFNDSMKAQRNKLNPKSQNLSEMVRGVVSGLEEKFDFISDTMHATPGLGLEWKSSSLNMTLNEIPHIPLCGLETGLSKGFADSIYQDTKDIDPTKTVDRIHYFFLLNSSLKSLAFSHLASYEFIEEWDLEG